MTNINDLALTAVAPYTVEIDAAASAALDDDAYLWSDDEWERSGAPFANALYGRLAACVANYVQARLGLAGDEIPAGETAQARLYATQAAEVFCTPVPSEISSVALFWHLGEQRASA